MRNGERRVWHSQIIRIHLWCIPLLRTWVCIWGWIRRIAERRIWLLGIRWIHAGNHLVWMCRGCCFAWR